MKYVNIIIDISAAGLDRPFSYRVPDEMEDQIDVGSAVLIPFGKANKERRGYVISVNTQPGCDPAIIKDIIRPDPKQSDIEGDMLSLAWWMKNRYGSTMSQALSTVMPARTVIKRVQQVSYRLCDDIEAVEEHLASKRCGVAARRLLEALKADKELSAQMISSKLAVSSATIKSLEEKKLIEKCVSYKFRNPVGDFGKGSRITLNTEQQAAADEIWNDYVSGGRNTWLIQGITGSGKTEVYMELIERVIAQGRQAIVLIPEIALTYQTVMRFYRRFGDRVSIVNSRMSQGERYDQFLRARNGEIDIMIGPRSALFSPFPKLGLVIIDEEHEDSYRSEQAPRYLARDVAIHRCEQSGGFVVLGSATPSVESSYLCDKGIFKRVFLNRRGVSGSNLANVSVVDMRRELKDNNRSVLSRQLHDMIAYRLERREQIMLFLNRRGFSNFLSCRSCGKAIMCPKCDVALTYHNDGTLRCHYCGFKGAAPDRCPNCDSPYLAGLGIGTQKAQALIESEFPGVRILRMDMDTTAQKGAHERILKAFGNHEADILLGTQMIVKGHDFADVTLVGILVADRSLYAPSYRAAEKTFQLLTQAAGRAGRGQRCGDVVIQTYRPDHYAIRSAANQDYKGFYDMEISFRKTMGYPPVSRMLSVLVGHPFEKTADRVINECAAIAKQLLPKAFVIGPAADSIGRINNIYRRVLFVKSVDVTGLMELMRKLESTFSEKDLPELMLQIDVS